MSTQLLLLMNGVTLVLLGVTIYFTRATLPRVAGALVGGVAATLVGVGGDKLGYFMGWWHYTFVNTPYGPLLMYTAVAFWYGAGVALIGWRVIRRFGGRGLVGFAGFMAIYGPARDYAGAAFSGFIVFAPGIVPVLADAACWAGGMALAQGMMRLAAGPARKDRLARLPTRGV